MTSDCREPLSGVVLSAVVVLAGVLGVTALPLAAAQGAGVAGTTGATFNQSTVTEDRGDIAVIGLDLTNVTGTNATVTVGSEAVNYETNVTVNDSDADGRVALSMNTYVAGTGDNETGVYDAANDTVTATNRTTGPLDAPLEASAYNLSVAVDGRETDTATLELAPQTTNGLVTWTEPAASFDNTTNASEVAAAVNGGRITATDTVAEGDVLVNQFRLSGVYGALAATDFSRLVETGALDFSMVQTNPETNRPPKRLDLNRSLANGSIRVIPDGRNDVLYVDVDTGAATFENGTPTAGDEFETTLTLDGNGTLARSDHTITANVSLVGAELSLGEVSLSADPNRTVAGTTSVAPGSEVTVSLQGNGTSSFVKTNTTRVKPNGSFAATFNLLTVAPRTRVTARADGPLNTTDRTTATVRPSRTNESVGGTASLSVAGQTTTGETVRVTDVRLSAGGFVVVHAPNVSRMPVESVLGASTYLENGTSGNVTVTLDRPLDADSRVVVMAHTDSNGNEVYDFSSSNGTEDRPYTADGGPVTATAGVTVRNATTMAAASGEARTTNASGAAVTATDTAGTNATNGSDATAAETTTENGRGFGIVAAIFGGLVAGLVVLAVWRER